MLVLTMEFKKAVPQILERRGRRERVIDERATSSLRGDLAAHDLFAAVGAFEHRLHGGRVFSGADKVCTGATAKEQVDGADEYRLPRSRFARQDVETRFEFDVELVDDRQAADAEKAEHGETGTPIVSDL